MIYIALLLLLFILHSQSNQTQKSNITYWGICLFLSLFIGLRYRVGGDTLWYNNLFDEGAYPSLDELFNGYDYINAYFYPGWLLLNASVKSFIGDFWGVQLIQALLINITCFYIFDKYYKERRYTCILIYYFFYYLYFNTEIMRESISTAFFFLSYKYLIEKIWSKYYLFCGLSFFFHPSAIVTFVIPILLMYSNLLKKQFKFYYILIIVMAFMLTYDIQSFISIMPTEFIKHKADYYMTREKSFNGIFGVIIMQVLPILGLLPIIRKNHRKDTKEDTFYNLFLIYLIICSFSIFTDGFYRLLNYFMPILVIQITKVLYLIRKTKVITKSKIFATIALCMMTLVQTRYYFFTDLLNIGSSEFKYYQRWYPYHSIFDKQKENEREIIYFKSMGHG